jgi:hypothetical protein
MFFSLTHWHLAAHSSNLAPSSGLGGPIRKSELQDLVGACSVGGLVAPARQDGTTESVQGGCFVTLVEGNERVSCTQWTGEMCQPLYLPSHLYGHHQC